MIQMNLFTKPEADSDLEKELGVLGGGGKQG